MQTPYDTRLPVHLRDLKHEIEGYARGYGLDFYETIFEVIDADDLNEIAAYGGFPTRYPHWSFGMAYEELRKGYDYGLSKIYEMVINNDPCYAYLMRSNHTVDQKLVMSHVYGHCLAPETLIETETGSKPIVDIREGVYVLTHKGAYRRVRACAARPFKGRIRRLQLDCYNTVVRITAEHPVYVARGGKMLWVEAGAISKGELVALPRLAVAIAANRVILPGDWERQELGDLSEDYQLSHVRSNTSEHYDGLVYNFSVEEDESYTLAAGFVVHNCDFFKNNAYFAHTNRKMMDEIANHGARIRSYAERFGEDEVEAFVDRCMSIDDLIDIHSVAIRRREPTTRYDFQPDVAEPDGQGSTRFTSKDYMDEYINPPGVLRAEEDAHRKQAEKIATTSPSAPRRTSSSSSSNTPPSRTGSAIFSP